MVLSAVNWRGLAITAAFEGEAQTLTDASERWVAGKQIARPKKQGKGVQDGSKSSIQWTGASTAAVSMFYLLVGGRLVGLSPPHPPASARDAWWSKVGLVSSWA